MTNQSFLKQTITSSLLFVENYFLTWNRVYVFNLLRCFPLIMIVLLYLTTYDKIKQTVTFYLITQLNGSFELFKKDELKLY